MDLRALWTLGLLSWAGAAGVAGDAGRGSLPPRQLGTLSSFMARLCMVLVDLLTPVRVILARLAPGALVGEAGKVLVACPLGRGWGAVRATGPVSA